MGISQKAELFFKKEKSEMKKNKKVSKFENYELNIMYLHKQGLSYSKISEFLYEEYGLKRTIGNTALRSFIKVRERRTNEKNKKNTQAIPQSIKDSSNESLVSETKTVDILTSSDIENKKIQIELLNDEPNELSHRYLMCSVVCTQRDTYKINEANYLALGAIQREKIHDVNDVQKLIIENQLMKDYELFIFNASALDRTIKFYRLYQGKFHIVETWDSTKSYFEKNRDYFNEGQKRLFALLPEVLN